LLVVREIRVGNISNPSGAPFRGLQHLPYVAYEEGFSQDNARKLQEGELDLALIPINFFAASGSLVGLDFGVVGEHQSEMLTLVAHRPVEELETIYVYHDATASVLFMKLLLINRWHSKARLVPSRDIFTPIRLGEREGIILRRPHVTEAHSALPHHYNLMEAWSDLTGCPFVFLIWATRPGVLNSDELRQVHDALYRSAKAYKESAGERIQSDTLDFYDQHTHYYLSSREIDALNYALREANYEGLLPEASYRSARIRLLDRNPALTPPERNLNQLLGRVVRRERLGLSDGLSLAEEASTSDLGLAAQRMMQQSFEDVSSSKISIVRECTQNKIQRIVAMAATESDELNLSISPAQHTVSNLSYWEQTILMATRNGVVVSGFPAWAVLSLADNERMHVREVLSRLTTAGLSGLSAEGGGMLVEGANPKKIAGRWIGSEWLRVMKWAHRYGLETECMLSLDARHSWETRFLHLQKIRQLQDYNPGFRAFYLDSTGDSNVPPEERLRALCLCRLFLDNIATVQEICDKNFSLSQLIGVSLAVNHVRFHEFDSCSKAAGGAVDKAEVSLQRLREKAHSKKKSQEHVH